MIPLPIIIGMIVFATEARARQALMGPKELAAYIGVPLATVYAMNHRSTGPRRIRVGKYVRYRQGDVDAWLDQQQIAGRDSDRK